MLFFLIKLPTLTLALADATPLSGLGNDWLLGSIILSSAAVLFWLLPYLLQQYVLSATQPLARLQLHCFTSLSLLALAAYSVKVLSFISLTLLLFWLAYYSSRQKSTAASFSRKVLLLIDLWELGKLRSYNYRYFTVEYYRQIAQFFNYWLSNPQKSYQLLLLLLVLAEAIYYRTDLPLQTWRLAHPQGYLTLLQANQLLANQGDLPIASLAHLSALLTALVTMFAAIPAMIVIRWLGVITGVFSVIILIKLLQHAKFSPNIGFLIGHFFAIYSIPPWQANFLTTWIPNLNVWYFLTGNNELPSATTALLFQIVYNNGQWAQFTLNDPYLAALSLAGAIIARLTYFSQLSRRAQLLDILSYAVLISLSMPLLLPGLLVLLITHPQHPYRTLLGLGLLAITGLIAAAIALLFSYPGLMPTITLLPLSLLLLLATLLQALSWRKLLSNNREHHYSSDFKTLNDRSPIANLLTILIILSTGVLLPPLMLSGQFVGQYLESESSARQTSQILRQLPAKTYLLVAPPEQFAQVYGVGRYADLATFTAEYAQKVNNPQFQFQLGLEYLLIMVEKQPFVTFQQEATLVDPTILADPTYRHYRSLAGRSSLQFQALQLCRTYQQHHPQLSRIYYEDDWIVIYQFARN